MIYQSYFVGENTSALTIYSNLSLNNKSLNEFSQKLGKNGLISHKKYENPSLNFTIST
jgi:hypothetical protein